MIYQYIIISLFVFWFVATIIVQFRDHRWTHWLKSKDYFSLLPLWTFFAPNPGTNDYHLLYREEDGQGSRSPWQEIAINEDRELLTSIWNPTKRGKKVLADVIQNVLPMIQEYKDTPRAIVFSIPYLLILNAIMREQKILDAPARKQFLLAASDGYGSTQQPQMILVSEFHPID